MVYHTHVTWKPEVSRFIFAQGHLSDALGIFAGRTPWGPWKTVYYGQFLDSLWKFTYQFPQKWMAPVSGNIQNFYMSFSGYPEYDHLSIIQGTFTLVPTPTPTPTTATPADGR